MSTVVDRRVARSAAFLALVCLSLTACSREVEVPDVEGQVVTEAVRTLQDLGLSAELNGVELNDEDIDQWTVGSQHPSAGPAPSGDSVRLQAVSVLEVAVDACEAGSVGDRGRSLSLDMEGEDAGSGDLAIDDIFCVLSELDVPDSVIDKMQSTTSLDGRVEDDWNGIEASWKYHPDNGLDVLLELG